MRPKFTPMRPNLTRLKLATLLAAAALFAAALAAGCKPSAAGDARAAGNANAQAAQAAQAAPGTTATTAATAQPGGATAAAGASPAAPGQPPAPGQTAASHGASAHTPGVAPAPGGGASVAASSGVASSGSAAGASAKPFDPCALLTAEEIREVQGEAVRDAKASRRNDSSFAVAQCFYTTPTYTKSVSLEVTQRGASQVSVREFWKASVERAEAKREKKNERRKKAGRAQAGPGARPVEGFGDEAYWVSTNANSTLYAFKNDSLLRISIGGPQSEDERMRKIKDLALKALARM